MQAIALKDAPLRPHNAFWPAGLPWSPEVPDTSLWANLAATALKHGSKTAYISPELTLTWQQVHDKALALAGWLHSKGVKKGDCVLLFMPNSPQFVVATYAILRADAVMVPVNIMNRAEEFRHYLRDTNAQVVLTCAELRPIVEQAQAEAAADHRATHVLSDLDAAIAHNHAPAAHTASADDLAVMPYTSGTTGFPKGCMHTHGTVMFNTVAAARWTNVTSDAVGLCVIPMFHVTGMVGSMHMPVLCGSTVVILPRWNRDEAAALVAKHRVTHWSNIPTMIIDLMASPKLAHYDLSGDARGGCRASARAIWSYLH
jgi:fatty-acyl-CoA synthase